MFDLSKSQIQRRKTREITVGPLRLGGSNPVRVQSMTTPKTADAPAVIKQVNDLAMAGCEIVRVTVNEQEAADALPHILSEVGVPIIADVHFDYKMAFIVSGIGQLICALFCLDKRIRV